MGAKPSIEEAEVTELYYFVANLFFKTNLSWNNVDVIYYLLCHEERKGSRRAIIAKLNIL
jgi:hypothetical protein